MGISRNSINTFASQIIIFLFSTIASIIVTRALGPTGKGIYTSIFIILLTVVDVLRLNIDVASVYYLGSKKYKTEEFLGAYAALIIVLSCCAFGVYFFLTKIIHAHFLRNINPTYLNIAIFSIPLYLIDVYASSLLWGLIDIKRYNWVRICKAFSSAVLSLAVVLFSNNVLFFLIAGIASVAAAVFLNLIFLRNYVKKISFAVNPGLIKNLFIYGSKGIIGNLLTSVVYRIGPYMVMYFCGMQAMGFYSVVLYAEFLWHIPFSINTALFPVLAHADTQDKAWLAKAICRHSAFITYASALILIVLSKYLITGFYGQAFSPSIAPFCILLFGIAAGSITNILKSYFNGIGKPQINTFVSMFTVIIAILVNYFLVKNAGINGAALAGSSVYILTSVIFIALFIKSTKSRLADIVLIKKEDFSIYRQMLRSFYVRTRRR